MVSNSVKKGLSDMCLCLDRARYRIIYVQNNNISKGIECVKETMPASKYRDEIIDFILASDKGVIRGMI
jgi:acyl-[acyl carrier protein]--UDP-N-acetylglucosamine O-acyltransferase